MVRENCLTLHRIYKVFAFLSLTECKFRHKFCNSQTFSIQKAYKGKTLTFDNILRYMETTRKNIPVKERLKEFIASLGISEREFCRKIGVSSAYVESIKQSVSPKVLQAISIHYPKLNPSWLLVGNGEMLFGEKKVEPERGGALPSEVLAELLVETRNEKAKLITANARLTDVVASQQRTIEELTRQLKKVAAQPGDAAISAAVG